MLCLINARHCLGLNIFQLACKDPKHLLPPPKETLQTLARFFFLPSWRVQASHSYIGKKIQHEVHSIVIAEIAQVAKFSLILVMLAHNPVKKTKPL